MDISGLLQTMVSITQFNKGKASQLFTRAKEGETLVVIRNSEPVAVILSPREYEILRAFPKLCHKIGETGKDMDSEELQSLLEQLKVYDESGRKNV